MKVYQLVESLAIGDAVANDAVALDGLFRALGLNGGIFACNKNNVADRYLGKIAFPASELPKPDEEDVIIVHYAIYNEFYDSLLKTVGHKVLVYHNVTPPKYFFRYNMGLYDATRKGLKQIKDLRDAFDFCIADSDFNRQNLIDMGYKCQIHVCPVLIPFSDYDKMPSRKVIRQYGQDDYENILFVGRVVPHKKVEDVIHAFALYKKNYNKRSRLFIVGGDDMGEYHNRLTSYIERLRVSDVIITGSVPFTDILAYYSIASVFVTMSEHEGLCVPVLEACYFKVPVIAYSCTALPYTMGDAGVLLEEKDYLLCAAWIDRLIRDKDLRRNVIDNQLKQLKQYEYDRVSGKMLQILKPLLPRDALRPIDIDGLFKAQKNKLNDFPLVMPIKDTDWNTACKSLPYIIRNLKPKRVVFISSTRLKPLLPQSSYVQFIDENELLEGLSFRSVADIIGKTNGDERTAGWYLQQFLKLGYARVCADEYYLVWDADTLPVRPIPFFDSKTKKPFLNLKKEYIPAYFSTINVLLEMDKCREESFITEHMLFNTALCKQMLEDIESQEVLPGKSFWEKCIWGTDNRETNFAFSEYETYGTYVMTKYPDLYQTRKLETLRGGADFLGENPSGEMIDWAATIFDTISFEHWGCTFPWIAKLAEDPTVRNKYAFDTFIQKVLVKLHRRVLLKLDSAEAYYTMRKHLDFDFFFENMKSVTGKCDAC